MLYFSKTLRKRNLFPLIAVRSIVVRQLTKRGKDMIHRQQTTLPTTTPYDRCKDLPSLIAMWPREIADFSEKGSLAIIAEIEKALRGERRRGKAGHWTYSLARHISLVKALKAEQAMLSTMTKHNSIFGASCPAHMPECVAQKPDLTQHCS